MVTMTCDFSEPFTQIHFQNPIDFEVPKLFIAMGCASHLLCKEARLVMMSTVLQRSVWP